MPKKPLRPGELIINRYMHNATEEERSQALERLRALAAVLMRIEARKKYTASDSRDSN